MIEKNYQASLEVLRECFDVSDDHWEQIMLPCMERGIREGLDKVRAAEERKRKIISRLSQAFQLNVASVLGD